MNTLIIAANPKEDSLSISIAERYSKLAVERGDTVDILDLYRTEYQQPFFTYDNSNDLNKTEEMAFFQDKISWANHIVFVFPYWWGSMPAILKNFIDWNFSRGFAFEYVNSRPKGLLSDKVATVFTTTGAPSILYKLTGANSRIKKMFKSQILSFCGIKLRSFNILGGIDKSRTDIIEVLNSIKY